ncbi:MAG: helix-hairpin-helix domain-containing protein [Coriobacteriia bacterium]|nr:helix-hairpin-helix domain-containing protein [Coriobacteriia bacterium]
MKLDKRWVIPGLIGLTILGLIGIRVFSPLFGGKKSSAPATFDAAKQTSVVKAGSENTADINQKAGADVSSQTTTVTVYVSGCVNAPGVYALIAGARVVEAVACARGVSKNAQSDAVNFAAVIEDGQQIYIPSKKEVEGVGFNTYSALGGGGSVGGSSSGGTGSSGGSSTKAAPVNLNTATEEQLDTLPGVGPVTAAKIVADRSANGPFSSLDDLSRVSGIGEKKCAALVGLAVAK